MDRELRRLVDEALAEDRADADATTTLLVDAGARGLAVITAKAPGVISGHRAAEAVFARLDDSIRYRRGREDGERIAAGDRAATIEGPLASILAGERTALNFLGRLSGVATLTSRFAAAVEKTGTTILDTRKTTPGLRRLEKEAVVHGGGANHRANLAAMVLVKENHIAAAGGLGPVIALLGPKELAAAEIEVSSLAELAALREATPFRIMLDNFDPDSIAAAVREVESWPRRPEIEVSGGITLESVARYALPGVDFISVGSLTSSAPSLDLSLTLEAR